MYKVFENIPLEVREKAYIIFANLPADGMNNWKQVWGSPFPKSTWGNAVCPLGALVLAAGRYGTSTLTGFTWTFKTLGWDANQEDSLEFQRAWDTGEIDNLAEAMGVPS